MDLEKLLDGFEKKEKVIEIFTKLKTDNEALEEKYKNDLKDINKKRNAEIISLKDKVGEYENKIKEYESNPGNVDKSKFLDLEVKYKETNEALSTLKNALAEKEELANRSLMTSELTKALGGKIYSADAHIENLIFKKNVIAENGKIYFKDGEETISFEKGVEKFLNSGKVDRVNSQRGGSGGGSDRANQAKTGMTFLDAVSE